MQTKQPLDPNMFTWHSPAELLANQAGAKETIAFLDREVRSRETRLVSTFPKTQQLQACVVSANRRYENAVGALHACRQELMRKETQLRWKVNLPIAVGVSFVFLLIVNLL